MDACITCGGSGFTLYDGLCDECNGTGKSDYDYDAIVYDDDGSDDIQPYETLSFKYSNIISA